MPGALASHMVVRYQHTSGCWWKRARMPDAAAAAATPPIRLPLLCSCSIPICVSKRRLREDRLRMMGDAHMMDWEEQLWTHTSMVMAGTSYHSDAAMRSSAVIITIIIIARTAAIWREADIAHVSRSHEEVSICVVGEAHEALEPTTMTMTSDAGPCIPSPSNRPTKQPSERAKDTAWQGAQQQQQQLMCGCIVDELALCISPISSSLVVVTGHQQQRLRPWEVMCVDVPLPRMTTMIVVGGGRSLPKPS
ncbi:hypothetical protein PTSG_09832 [Salpingoeca rosetta]|uniref:Uncharacterized protein n=1 Tax=Salpingoeca rosetta (strain ATCC 50818 / BSB-021) TaxID=946362 RepID=F2UNA0_SALR5|nr:uncharacterized protein PTSG_09832 [Salpingoeca rosetta]EGD79105.1 hypothetical protein PTSG_09832 [Salpingoeca rosetta]|eukprot:XP_004989190.1 hypothetical protein PTSG_09832 [Salpingoeca rosetta]